ncbi:MAG TPA: hypothetical protein VLC93_04355, partial [Myxococcota bacterium]|nr:hypothetical protein [Myxococcota bacterium]
RNTVIKADNQVKNLSLDVKNFERRFEQIEKRGKFTSLAVNVFVGLVITIAAYLVFSARSRSYIADAERAQGDAQQARDSAQKQSEDLNRRLAELDAQKKKAIDSASVSKKVLDLLDQGNEKGAVDMLDQVNLTTLTELEARLMEKRVGDLRKKAAEDAYEQGRKLAETSGRSAEAVDMLKKSLSLDPNFRYVVNVRYLLATELFSLKRYDEAEPVLRDLSNIRDPSLREEIRFLLGASLAQTQKVDEARRVLGEIIAARTKYASQAKTYLQAMELAEKNKQAPPAAGAPPQAQGG